MAGPLRGRAQCLKNHRFIQLKTNIRFWLKIEGPLCIGEYDKQVFKEQKFHSGDNAQRTNLSTFWQMPNDW